MLRLPISIFLIAGLTAPLGAGADPLSHSILTVILDFQGPYSRTVVDEMERETAAILNSTGALIDWRIAGEGSLQTDNDLVVMTFAGVCEYGQQPVDRGPGPLGLTRIVDGTVQPFGEVECDRVVNSVHNAMPHTDYARGNLLIGRAVGRVVAHELVHMLTKSTEHGADGVERTALTGKELISGYLPLSAFDIFRLRQELGYR
jgi:hypothetical protein